MEDGDETESGVDGTSGTESGDGGGDKIEEDGMEGSEEDTLGVESIPRKLTSAKKNFPSSNNSTTINYYQELADRLDSSYLREAPQSNRTLVSRRQSIRQKFLIHPVGSWSAKTVTASEMINYV